MSVMIGGKVGSMTGRPMGSPRNMGMATDIRPAPIPSMRYDDEGWEYNLIGGRTGARMSQPQVNTDPYGLESLRAQAEARRLTNQIHGGSTTGGTGTMQ